MVPFVVDVFVIRMGPDVEKFIERTQEKQHRCYHCANDHQRKQHLRHPRR